MLVLVSSSTECSGVKTNPPPPPALNPNRPQTPFFPETALPTLVQAQKNEHQPPVCLSGMVEMPRWSTFLGRPSHGVTHLTPRPNRFRAVGRRPPLIPPSSWTGGLCMPALWCRCCRSSMETSPSSPDVLMWVFLHYSQLVFNESPMRWKRSIRSAALIKEDV